MKWYIYGLFDARHPKKIKYVGQTRNLARRAEVHRRAKDVSTMVWAKSVRRKGGCVSLRVLQVCGDKSEAQKAERCWVDKFMGLINNNLVEKPEPPAIEVGEPKPEPPKPEPEKLEPLHTEPSKIPLTARNWLSDIGRKGGKAGSSENKSKAALARWAKVKAAKAATISANHGGE